MLGLSLGLAVGATLGVAAFAVWIYRRGRSSAVPPGSDADGTPCDLRVDLGCECEVQLTSELTHPNTVRIFDYGRTEGEELRRPHGRGR